MICVNCGKEISDDSKFCGFCGTPTAAPVPAPVPEAAPTPIVQPAPVSVPAPVVEPAPTPAMEPVPAPAPMPEAAPVAEPVPAPAPMPEAAPAPTPVQPAGFVPGQGAVLPTPMQPEGFVPGQQMPVSPAPMQGAQPTGAVPPAVPPAAEGEKKGKAGLIVLIVLLVLLLTGGGVLAFIFLNNGPIKKINKALESGDIETVVELYGDLSNDEDKEEISEKLLEYAEEIRDQYFNEEMDYAEAIDTLNLLAGASLETDDEIEAIRAYVNRIYASRESYAAAEAYRASGDYALALAEYDNVISDDTLYYNKALTAIEEVKNELVDAAIEEANAFMNSGDYVSAEYVLNEALLALPGGSSELDNMLDTVRASMENNIISDILEDANVAVADGRISEAREILEDALAIYPGNTELQNALASLSVSSGTLVGIWMLEYDMQDLIVQEMGSDFDDFESSLILPLMFEFSEDGTFRMYLGENFKENYDKWEKALIAYMSDYLEQVFGIDKRDLEAILGISLEEYLKNELGEMEDVVDELVEEMEETRRYEVQDNRIYLSDEYGDMDYDSYELFELLGDSLILSEEGDNGEEILPGLSYPLTFTRVY